jgi:hypothetical protein
MHLYRILENSRKTDLEDTCQRAILATRVENELMKNNEKIENYGGMKIREKEKSVNRKLDRKDDARICVFHCNFA